jgi:hypothetical protein
VAPRRNPEKKSPLVPVSRTADYPGQAINIDLPFVPACHQVDVKLPAVSGSSGHLVIERMDEAEQEPDYPGKVFGKPDLSYAEAMQAFVEASQPLSGERKIEKENTNPAG